MMLPIAYIIFSYVIIILVIFLFFCSNTIYSLLLIIGIIISTSCLLLFLQLEFFAIIYTLVYIGVIAIFFIFTIMLLNLRVEKVNLIQNSEIFYSTGFFLLLNLILDFFVLSDFANLEHLVWDSNDCNSDKMLLFNEWVQLNINFKTIGFYLYTKYGFYLFIVGLLLLISLIASIQMIDAVRKELKL